ncbi:hypothetical protein, partial [Rhodococcus koreensis]
VVALGATTVPCEDPVVRESAVLFGRGAELEGGDDPAGAETAYREVIDLAHADWAPRAAYALGRLHHTQADRAHEQARVHDDKARVHDDKARVHDGQASTARDLADHHREEATAAYRQAADSAHPTWAPEADTALAALEATIKTSRPEPPKPEPPAEKTAVMGPPQKRTTASSEKVVPAPIRRPADTLDRGAWACVLAGVVVLTAAMVYCLLPYDVRGGVAVGILGAVLVLIGLLDQTREGRGWLLVGVAVVAAAAALILFPHWPASTLNTDAGVRAGVLVSAVLAIVGLLLILAPQRRRTPTRGAIIGLITAGAALVLAAVAVAVIPDLPNFLRGYGCQQSAFAGWENPGSCGAVSKHVLARLTVVAGTGVILLAAGAFAVWSRRRPL